MSADFSNISWPGWETVDLIGRGSFGAVYKIERKVFNDTEKAALKVISIPQNSSDIEEMYSDGYDNESITSTFQSHLESIVAEYSLMRKMNGCANIVNCDDVRYVQHDDGIGWDIFIKMELLTPLAKSLPAEISDEMVIKIAKDMCRALELCKKHGIVHRDIKPQNIFVSEHGDYKLGDFGIAKTVEKTTGGTKIGTYKYMAPEVYNNQPYGSAADIYSLGLVLYWLLNERRMPFLPLPPAKLRAGQDEDARYRRLSGEALPEPAHGSDELKRIVLKACAYDTQDRYSSAALMLDDLNRLTGEAIVAGAVASVDSDETEQQEDELTTGPVFVETQVQNAEPEEGEVDATIGPVFGSKVIAEERRDPAKLDKRKDGKKSFVKYALIALGVVAIIIILLLLKTCTGPAPYGDGSGQTTDDGVTAPYGDGSGQHSDSTTESNSLNHDDDKSISVSFDPNGGTVGETIRIISSGSPIGELPTPTRPGFDFNGWFTEDGKQITPSSTMATKEGVTVTARWSIIPYTASWNTGDGYTITVKRTSSPNANASIGTILNGATIYYGDVLTVSYIKNDYYSINKNGETAVTVTGNIDSSVIYAKAELNPVVDWVLASDMPAGAQIVETKWSYTLREEKADSASSLSGWIKYDTKRTGWGPWSSTWSTTDPSNGVRNVEPRTEYHYYRWVNGDYVYTYNPGGYTLQEKWTTYELPKSSLNDFYEMRYEGTDTWANRWVMASFENNWSTDRTWTRTTYRYQEPIYTYYYYRNLSMEASSDPTGQKNVSDVVKYVKYRAK